MKKSKKEKTNKRHLIKIASFIIIVISMFLPLYEIYTTDVIEENNERQIEEFYNVQKITKQEFKQSEKYIGILYLDKINLKRGFYNKDSKLNNVNKNLELLKDSDLPDKENGNVILAAHRGNSKVAFFNDLIKINIGDEARIDYDNKSFIYRLDNIYEIDKTGKAVIKRDYNKNTLTLITCKKNEKKQNIFIFYLK